MVRLTATRVVLDTKIDVLVNAETKVALVTEVGLLELKLLHLQALLDQLESLVTAYGDVGGDSFVTADTELTDGVTGWRRKKQNGNKAGSSKRMKTSTKSR